MPKKKHLVKHLLTNLFYSQSTDYKQGIAERRSLSAVKRGRSPRRRILQGYTRLAKRMKAAGLCRMSQNDSREDVWFVFTMKKKCNASLGKKPSSGL